MDDYLVTIKVNGSFQFGVSADDVEAAKREAEQNITWDAFRLISSYDVRRENRVKAKA